MEWLESSGVRPRQARYQAALRPDRACVLIIRDFATRMLSNGPTRPSTVPKLCQKDFIGPLLCQNSPPFRSRDGLFSPALLSSSAASSANTA